jgi:hypothetical protein
LFGEFFAPYSIAKLYMPINAAPTMTKATQCAKSLPPYSLQGMPQGGKFHKLKYAAVDLSLESVTCSHPEVVTSRQLSEVQDSFPRYSTVLTCVRPTVCLLTTYYQWIYISLCCYFLPSQRRRAVQSSETPNKANYTAMARMYGTFTMTSI